MGIQALTIADDGSSNDPKSRDDWRDWVSASATRNFMIHNTLIDWLRLYGKAAGFRMDTEMPGYDGRTDFTRYIMDKGNAFEAAIVVYLKDLKPIVTISSGPMQVRSLDKAQETLEAMAKGLPIIHQGVLRDPESRTYGAPDFLIRSDVLAELFPGSITLEEAAQAAPDLPDSAHHYIVVDVKFTGLHFLADGSVSNSGSARAYKTQLYIYNRALAKLQGYLPATSFLLGRSWEQGSGERKQRALSALDRLGPVPYESSIGEKTLTELVEMATGWMRRVRSEGSKWSVLPEPSVPELWPNMGETSDFPWHAAKSQIGRDAFDLTLLWQVNAAKRDSAHRIGLRSWQDPRCSAEALGVTGKTYRPTLQAMLDINQSVDGPPVSPAKVQSAREEWATKPELEFYVDFETVTDLADDFSKLPNRGGQTLIFMVGCGHIEEDEWRFSSFVADALETADEASIIDQWITHMGDVAKRLMKDGGEPKVIHWSPAESSFLESSFTSVKSRHPDKNWPTIHWYDFLSKVVRTEPVVVRGSLGFGLKSVAKAMKRQGLIETTWDDSPLDGLGAMVGAWWCADQAKESGSSLSDIPLMQEIARYNEVDCRVMMEIVNYLRANH
jgi:hypothetical protein